MGVPVIGPLMVKILGTRNQRMVKRYLRLVDQINDREAATRLLTDAQLRAKTDEFRAAVKGGTRPVDMIPEVFAVAREAMDRAVGIRNIFNPHEKFDPSRLPDAARALYDFLWKEYCDWYLELTKPRVYGDGPDDLRAP